jgi:CDGSH-type Zn-finger protein
MCESEKKIKIKILKDGPYIVSGNIHLTEKIITPKGKGYELRKGHEFPGSEEFALCRCGKSGKKPYCDGAHGKSDFDGTETASKTQYEERAELIEGPGLDLLDDSRCAFARFCHREKGNVWELVKNSDNPAAKEEAIAAANECPAGRLVAVDKEGNPIEPKYEPSIDILQDPEKGVSGGIFAKGNIPIEFSDGHIDELRNRVVLCRCGESKNKPFCDATHVSIKFSDQKLKSGMKEETR